MTHFIKQGDLLVNENFVNLLQSNALAGFRGLMDFNRGHLLKKNKFRSIIKIEMDGKAFYLKRHFWPWKEQIKSLIPGLSREDAANEWKNMLLLNDLGFHSMTPVAFGEKKKYGLPRASITLTESITAAEKLETYIPGHFLPPLGLKKVFQKRALIQKVASVAKKLHDSGLNHQDFYLGHLFIRPGDNEIFIVDLQRMHRREKIRLRDMIKDLAQLLYSSQQTGVLTRADFMRFAHIYFGESRLNSTHKKLIRKIIAKKNRIARHDAKLQQRKKNHKSR